MYTYIYIHIHIQTWDLDVCDILSSCSVFGFRQVRSSPPAFGETCASWQIEKCAVAVSYFIW